MKLQPHDRSVKLGREHEECAFRWLAVNDTARALDSFERAVSSNAALLSSWNELERLYRASGDTLKASVAMRQLGTLRRLPAPLLEAGSLFCDGEMAAARQVLEDFLRNGSHVEALRLLGRIAHTSGQLDDAAGLFERVLSDAPDYRAARADLVRTLMQQRRESQAQQQLDALLELEPGNWDYLVLGATIRAALGHHEDAISTYQRVAALAPGWTHLYLLLGNSLKAIGRQQEAIEAYETAAVRRPDWGDAYWSLANLKTYRFPDLQVSQMRDLECAPATRPIDRVHLCFALGKAFEDRAEYATSWHYYERGNRLKAVQAPYDPRALEREIERLIETYTAAFLDARAGLGHVDPELTPVFIVGLPRSGSTLVEQILASHSQVEGTKELPTVGRLARECESAQDYALSGARYLQEARAHTSLGKPWVLDKMPNNFRHIGLIHLMLPTAKIIDVRRDPMACCVSNLKQLYAGGQEFTYSSEWLARYYKSYVRLMNHWDAVLPERVLRVCYEDLVEDLEPQVQRLLQFCGLELESQCLEFYRTQRAIDTPSSEQVRQPINRRGLTDWRHFEPWLGSLKEALA